MRWTDPGRAIASMTERKVDCADSTLSANPGGSSAIVVMISPLTAHHGVEINLRRSGLGRRLLAPDHQLLTQRRDDVPLHRATEIAGLHQRIAQRNQPRLLTVATERVTETDLAARKPHRSPRHRRFAEIEWRTVAADPAAQHDEAVFRRAQILMRRQSESAEASGDLARLRVRQHGHCGLALGLLIVVLGHQIHRTFLNNLPNPSCL